MRSLAGHLLVAQPTLADPNFGQTVVLIVRHDAEGALGLILNRPLELTVKEACEALTEGECNVTGSLYKGGPCEGPLAAVHTSPHLSDIRIDDRLHFTIDREHLQELLREPRADVRFFANYSGWTAGQLENELSGNSWMTLPAKPEHVFQSSAESLWEFLHRQLSLGAWLRPDQIPDDPKLN